MRRAQDASICETKALRFWLSSVENGPKYGVGVGALHGRVAPSPRGARPAESRVSATGYLLWAEALPSDPLKPLSKPREPYVEHLP